MKNPNTKINVSRPFRARSRRFYTPLSSAAAGTTRPAFGVISVSSAVL